LVWRAIWNRRPFWVERLKSGLTGTVDCERSLAEGVYLKRAHAGPVLMTPLAFAFPAAQWRECRARLANAHGASFPQTDVGYLDAGLPSLTTKCLRPCLAERGIATLGACSRPSCLDTRATSRWRTRQMIRSVMSVNLTLPQLSCMRNTRSGVVTSCSSIVSAGRLSQRLPILAEQRRLACLLANIREKEICREQTSA
jgi:hypothetical protein